MSSSIKLMISVPVPPPPAPTPQKEVTKAVPIEDEVREALECIDSGHDSGVEWSLIRGIYSKLSSLKKPSDRAKNLMKMIEPTLSKYGYHHKQDAR